MLAICGNKLAVTSCKILVCANISLRNTDEPDVTNVNNLTGILIAGSSSLDLKGEQQKKMRTEVLSSLSGTSAYLCELGYFTK